MKLDCDIVRDLLPSYVEDLVSPRTKQAVEEHLASCPACRRLCGAMRAPEPEVERPGEDASVRCLQKLRRERRRAVLLAALALLVTLACLGGLIAVKSAYEAKLYRSRSPLISAELVSRAAIGVLPDGKLAICADAGLQWDRRLPLLELRGDALTFGFTRSQEEDQQTDERFPYWLVIDLPQLEAQGLDVKSFGYQGADAPWWRRGQKLQPLSQGLAAVLAQALPGGEAFALAEGQAPVLTVLSDISPRAAARDNAEQFLKALYTTGWYAGVLEEKTTIPELFGGWCSGAGLESAEYVCMKKCMIGLPGGWESGDVDYTAQSVLLTPGLALIHI